MAITDIARSDAIKSQAKASPGALRAMVANSKGATLEQCENLGLAKSLCERLNERAIDLINRAAKAIYNKRKDIRHAERLVENLVRVMM